MGSAELMYRSRTRAKIGQVSIPNDHIKPSIAAGLYLEQSDILKKVEWIRTNYPSAEIQIKELKRDDTFSIIFDCTVEFEDEEALVHYKMTHD